MSNTKLSTKILEFKRSTNSVNPKLKKLKEGPADFNVIDLSERRKAIINQERREVKRTILTQFIGAFLVIPGKGLQRCAVYDISEMGMAFDLDIKYGHFTQDEKVPVRIYMNQFTYFSFDLVIENVRLIESDEVFRHGCRLDAQSSNSEALNHFVRFIESVSAHLKSDHGDVVVSRIQEG